MNYQDPELKNNLASEYVLGTLRGQARNRFERLLQDDADLRRIVAEWEQKIGVLQEGLQPVPPSAQVWPRIVKRLGLTEHEPQPALGTRIWNNLFFWRGLSISSGLAAALLAVYIGWFAQPTIVVQQYVAVITNENQQASWLASADLENQQMTIKILNEQTLPLDKAFELWMLPDGGAAPVSMGLLSAASDKTLIISQTVITQLQHAKGLAVSLEPKGGSPTGLPTGPVLYQGKLINF